jgi:uncharacterized membrane protein HdeD (DUF308 family)
MNVNAQDPATIDSDPTTLVTHELAHLKKEWWWLMLLGVLLVVCGTIAIAYPPFTSVGAVMVLGVLLIVSGAATIVSSFLTGKWSAFLLEVLVGILYVIAGMAIMDAPVASTMLLTLFIAAFFIVVGTFRIVSCLALKFPQWGWGLLNGVITLLFGGIIYKRFTECPLKVALVMIGVLVGIELLLNGWTWMMLALSLRRLPAEQEDAPSA